MVDEPAKAKAHGEPLSVLVAEDEILVRLALAEFLRDCGFRVLEAANADEAIGLLSRDPDIRIVLTDVEMPGSMDGYGLSQWVRQHCASVRVIITSGHAHAARQATALCAEAHWVAKPYDPTHLMAVIRRLVSE